MNIPWTSIGLVLDIVGVAILYFNGPPISEILPNGSELLWTDEDPERAKKAQREILYSKIALGFIIVGFILQFIGSIVS